MSRSWSKGRWAASIAAALTIGLLLLIACQKRSSLTASMPTQRIGTMPASNTARTFLATT